MAIREHPIIFSTELIPKILDGTKTMSRQTWGLEKINESPDRYSTPLVYKSITGEWFAWFGDKESSDPVIVKCPYGGVEDRLWVRETWATYRANNDWTIPMIPKSATVFYKADGDEYGHIGKKRSAMFMPRWASRINLEITDEKAARTQDLTLAEAIAEGYSSVEEANREFLRLAHLPEDANPWDWYIFFKLIN